MNYLIEWFAVVPPITRLYLLISIGLSLGVLFELITPLKLYFNWSLIWNKYQYWRLVTPLFYLGEFSTYLLIDLYIIKSYSSRLEKHEFRNKPAEYIVFLTFGSINFLIAAYFLKLNFMSNCTSCMMMYFWSRKNPNIVANIYFIHLRACFVPYFWLMI